MLVSILVGSASREYRARLQMRQWRSAGQRCPALCNAQRLSGKNDTVVMSWFCCDSSAPSFALSSR